MGVHENLLEQHDHIITWKRFLCYWPYIGESTGHRRITLTKGQYHKLWCFLWAYVEKTFESLVIWDAIMPIRRHCNEFSPKNSPLRLYCYAAVCTKLFPMVVTFLKDIRQNGIIKFTQLALYVSWYLAQPREPVHQFKVYWKWNTNKSVIFLLLKRRDFIKSNKSICFFSIPVLQDCNTSMRRLGHRPDIKTPTSLSCWVSVVSILKKINQVLMWCNCIGVL